MCGVLFCVCLRVCVCVLVDCSLSLSLSVSLSLYWTEVRKTCYSFVQSMWDRTKSKIYDTINQDVGDD